MHSITATLGSSTYAGLVPSVDTNYNKFDNRFGTTYIPPLTREQHSRREFLGVPYRYADDLEYSFESGRPELEGTRLVFLHEPLLENDADTDWQLEELRRFRERLEKEARDDAIRKRRQRDEIYAVRKDPSYNPMDGEDIPHHLQRPDKSDDQKKQGRGRPRKLQNATVVLNAPRGSPLPSKRALARINSGGNEGKRGPGRPRKYAENNGLNLMPPNSAPRARRTGREGRTRAKGTVTEWHGGGKWKPGMAPWSSTMLSQHLKCADEDGSPVIPSSSTNVCVYKPSTNTDAALREAREGKRTERMIAEEREDEGIADMDDEDILEEDEVMSENEEEMSEEGYEETSEKEEEMWEMEDEEMTEPPPWNIFAEVKLPTRATRSGKAFAD